MPDRVTIDNFPDVARDADGRNILSPEGLVRVEPVPFDTGWVTVNGIVAASLYTTGDVVGEPITLPDIPTQGRMETVLVIDEDKEEIACNLVIFDKAPTVVADHDIFVIGVDEYSQQVGDIPITNADYSTYSGSSFAQVNNLGARFGTASGSLVVYWVTRGGPTVAAGKVLRIRFRGYSDHGGE